MLKIISSFFVQNSVSVGIAQGTHIALLLRAGVVAGIGGSKNNDREVIIAR